jgi:hypothetical protein
VKKEFVGSYGKELVVSVFGIRTLKVAQQPSTFSILKILEVVVSRGSLLIGILQGTPLPQHVYNITGRVLQFTELVQHPKKPLSQVSKQASPHSAFCCKILITVKISAIHLQSSELLLHIKSTPSLFLI